ncbi:MAG: PLP-dependent transferase [Roseburia sp.]|nr:PLP-dependent transferase [Roseburia sp.]
MTYPTTQTHADVPKEIRERNGITESTLRLSVGIEDVKDLLFELDKVFREIEGELHG